MAVGSPVDSIKSKVDLIQLVSSYVPALKKSGRNWWACCPFHAEKTPSFCIWPEDDRWKCFGCGAGGDVFAFIMRIENLDFSGALHLLAERTGVVLENRPVRPEDSSRKQRLLQLHAAASLWFHNFLLNHPQGAKARAFVEKRHLAHQTVVDFQLGYAPDSWDMLRSHLSQLGYSIEEQLAAGVLHESEKGSPYDRFRDRVIYPIRNAGGHVVAFGGRDLSDDKKTAKFINSPQTELFDKSATLYGLDRAKNSIRSMDRAIVVEGYMDAIMAHQHGVTNAVCSMGTSLTERQVEQIKKLTTNLVLALDPDTAGDIAAGRGVEIGEQTFDQELVPVPSVNGLIRLEARLKADIRVMELPRGKDPDEVIHENLDEWNRLVEHALPLLEYKFQRILEKHDLTEAKGKADAVRELGVELAKVPDPVQRNHYLGKMAQRLAKLAGAGQLKEDELQLAMAKSMTRRPKAAGDRDPHPSPRGGEENTQHPALSTQHSVLGLDAEDYLVMRALRYLDAADHWRKNLQFGEIVRSVNREILEYLCGHLKEGSKLDFDRCPDDLPEPVFQHVELLRDLSLKEPAISDADLPVEFHRLLLKVRERNAVRSQLERAALLSEMEAERMPEVESAALPDLAAIHHAKTELGRRTLLARP